MESYPQEFAAVLKHLAEEARGWTFAKAHGDEAQAAARLAEMQGTKDELESLGVLPEEPCQQILDMALSTASVTLCEVYGWGGLEDRQQELADACSPLPDQVSFTVWNRTRDMFFAGARLSCAQARGDQQAAEQHDRTFERHSRILAGFGPVGTGGGPVDREAYISKAREVIPATVIMFSGCQDSQTSADVFSTTSFGLPTDAGPGGAGGACTNSMIKALSEGSDYTWVSLLERMRSILHGKYTQIPMLSSSRPMDLRTPFRVLNKRPTGRTRALLVGINYVGTKSELNGCHNDVETMRRYLLRSGYEESEMRILMDDGRHQAPTKDAIMQSFAWLIQGAGEGDSLFFHYSGHGASLKDDDGDEKDGMDEALVPADYERVGLIRDDDIFAALVGPLQGGCQLTSVLDCCHSGTILDLPFIFVADDQSMSAAASGQPVLMQENPNFDFGKILQVIKDHPGMAAAAAAVTGAVFFFKGPEKGKAVAKTLATVLTADNPVEALKGAAGGLFKSLFGK